MLIFFSFKIFILYDLAKLNQLALIVKFESTPDDTKLLKVKSRVLATIIYASRDCLMKLNECTSGNIT